MKKIKIYHYDAYHKFYISSSIEDVIDGVGLPTHSTNIEPPKCEEGYIAVFNGRCWDIQVDNFGRIKIKEINYNSGRNNDTYKPLKLDFYLDFPKYPSISQVCNTTFLAMIVAEKINWVHIKYDELNTEYNNIKKRLESPNLLGNPAFYWKYYFLAEEMVAAIRVSLDYLVQLTYLLTSSKYSDFCENNAIKIDCIGSLYNERNSKLDNFNDMKNILLGSEEYEKDVTFYLNHMNILSNSIKHSIMNPESYRFIGINKPTIVSFYAKNNNFNNEIIYSNSYACQLVMGFQDTVLRIIRNQKKYIELNPKEEIAYS